MLRIALGGISHESNTFNPIHTGLEDFNIIRGEGLLELRVSRFLLNTGGRCYSYDLRESTSLRDPQV